jgi:peptidyl-prolyl cis-trans isomerase C
MLRTYRRVFLDMTDKRTFAALALLVLFIVGGGWFAHAQDAVVARVGEIEISERELSFAEADLAEQFQQVPQDRRRAAVLKALIDIKLVAVAAEEAGLAETEEFKARVAFLRDRALHNNYFQKNVLETISEEEVRARYDREVAVMTPQEEVRARHILLKSKEEAEAVIDKLEAGEDFGELAKTESTGPSGPGGGDLGFFARGQMVPEFEEAAFALEDGEFTSEPVETQFGWHVIFREEHRTQAPPEFDAVKNQIRQVVLTEKYGEMVSQMRDDAEIEILDESLKQAMESGNAGGAGDGAADGGGTEAEAPDSATRDSGDGNANGADTGESADEGTGADQ